MIHYVLHALHHFILDVHHSQDLPWLYLVEPTVTLNMLESHLLEELIQVHVHQVLPLPH